MAPNWLFKWTAKSNGPKEFTHLLLNGGRLNVADQQHSLFLNEYSNAIARGEKLFIVESKTPIFRLFVDFDFKPPPPPAIIDAALRSASSVAGYYFDTTSRSIILRKDKDPPEKVGVHMTWDSIFVTTQTANAFRNHLVSKLVDACPDVDWKEIVDASVYAGSGLRMPWSAKVDNPSVYAPALTCVDNVLKEIPRPTTAGEIREWVRWTSIRAPDGTLTRSCVVTSEPVETEKSDVVAGPQENLAQHTEILQKIHETLPAPFAAQKFTGMHRFGDFCIVLRSSSRVCGNKCFKEHTKNTVYFVVLKKGHAYQRCYCRKDAVREGGVTCTDYTGDPWAIPQDIIDTLWPPPNPATVSLMDMMSKTRPPLKKARR